jgi:hypothetical protein
MPASHARATHAHVLACISHFLCLCITITCSASAGPLGSPGFVAPEIVAGGVHSPAMDVFSLGVLLFIMLVGVPVGWVNGRVCGWVGDWGVRL